MLLCVNFESYTTNIGAWIIITFNVTKCFLFLATGSQMIYASRNPLAVGSSVTLFSQDIVTTGTWISDNTLIVFIAPGNVNIAVSWNDRVAFNSTTSSLTITSVKLEDSGEYTLQAFSPNNFIHQLTLSVQGKDTVFVFTPFLIYFLTLNVS